MSKHPEVLWAQRSSTVDEKKNVIYLTVNLPDIKHETVDYQLTPNHISFKAKAGNAGKGIEEHDYAFDFDLFDEVDPEQSQKNVTDRSFVAVLRKKQPKQEYWPRITKEKAKTPWLKTDFSKWVDEDEQDEQLDLGGAGDDFDMGGMGGMPGGMPGMPGGMPGMPGGMPGMPGGMDFEQMMKSMGGDAGAGSSSLDTAGAEEEDEDDDDEGPPPLEEVEPGKA